MFKKPLCVIFCVLALTVALSSLTSASLVGWWKFDETSGTTAKDSSGGGYDGTLANGGTWTAGRFDGGLQLDGNDDHVQLNIGALVPTLKECTLAIWLKRATTGANWARVIDIGSSTASYIYVCPQDGGAGSLRVAIVAGNGVWNEVTLTSAAVSTTDWAHIAITISDSAKRMVVYRDGKEAGSLDNMTNSMDDLGNPTNNWLGRSEYSADPYLSGTIDDFRIYDEVLSPDAILRAMNDVSAAACFDPTPADGAIDVRPDAVLGWAAGEGAITHDVYLGTSSSDVEAATRTDPKGVLVSQDQSGTTYDPVGVLALGQTYYWRVDEIGSVTTKGKVWSFAAEAVAYKMTGITATASSVSNVTNTPAINTVNDSGMTGDLADSNNKAMWLSVSKGTFPAWIQYDFDGLYKLYEMKVWNHNTAYEDTVGFGAKSTVIEYSTDGTTWTKLGDFEFAQATGEEAQPANAIVSFNGVVAKAVKITINSSWKNTSQTGLSEVRFYYLPVLAREPSPATGSTGIDPTTLALGWRPGREAATHNVYLGTDANALTLAGSSTTPGLAPANMVLGAKYYWRVDEVNAAATPTTWAGAVWNFTTADYLVVDDIESYNDTTNPIYNVWLDGFNTSTNGAQVGYLSPTNGTFAETAIVHSGKQSMPVSYGNNNIILSEVTRTFAPAQDWSVAGVKTLTLFFHGATANTAGQLYVKINNTKITYPGDASILSALLWKQWNIDLSTVSGVKAVTSLTLGVTGSGKGTLYFDDIRLYETAPTVVTPADPGPSSLVAYYTMEGDAKDSKGGYDGTLNAITFADSVTTALSRAAVFNGTSSYIDLGAAFGTGVVSKLTDCTTTAWVYYSGSGNVWQRVFDFGTSSTNYVFLTTRNANSFPRFALLATGKGEVTATDSRIMSVGWHHLAGVVDASTMTIALYVDGALAQGGVTTPATFKDLGATTQNWIGRSMFSTDPYLTGSVDELKIYNRALTAGEIAYLAGDR